MASMLTPAVITLAISYFALRSWLTTLREVSATISSLRIDEIVESRAGREQGSRVLELRRGDGTAAGVPRKAEPAVLASV